MLTGLLDMKDKKEGWRFNLHPSNYALLTIEGTGIGSPIGPSL